MPADDGPLMIDMAPVDVDATEPDDVNEDDITSSTKISAARAALAALKSGDAKALADALQRHYDACSLDPERSLEDV